MTLAIPFPNIDPVLFSFGPIVIRWYALAYIVGLLVGWRYMRALANRPPANARPEDVDDFLVWTTLAVVLGGRLGYVLFYNPGYYLANPLSALALWQGGMSFHGGLLGVVVVTVWFARRRGIALLPFADALACVAPIGLLLGRLANFINGELFGRVTDLPWGVVFPRGGPSPRHPSQIYEAFLEGLVLLALMHGLWRVAAVRRRPGTLVGVFLAGYGLARAAVEAVREPDAHIGLLLGGTTLGQWLSLPMILAGAAFIARALRTRAS
jgi:phosphatidylglycerol:prolipoprotein diacylglycerol transferase